MSNARLGPIERGAAKAAAGLPGVEEGVACAGTAIESRTYKAMGKAFVFVRVGSVMLKLGPSLAQARELAAESGGTLKAGSGGWVTISGNATLEATVLKRWVKESHTLAASPAAKNPGPGKRTSTTKPSPRAKP